MNDPLAERLDRLENENARLKRENVAMSDELTMWKAVPREIG